MACTSMALKYFYDNNKKIILLAEDAFKNKVYSENNKEISDMKYREFANWIKNYFIKAEVYTNLSIKGIQYALSQGKLVMVSVNPNIRGYNTAPVFQKGGHLVLVIGYDILKKTFTINNPSGFVSLNTQAKHTLPIKLFKEYYSGRGILLSKIL